MVVAVQDRKLLTDESAQVVVFDGGGDTFGVSHSVSVMPQRSGCPIAGLFAAAAPALPGSGARGGVPRRAARRPGRVAAADARWLVVTGLLLAASLDRQRPRLARRAAGVRPRCGPVDAVARYGIGSLANAVLPASVGGVIRIAPLLEARPPGGRGLDDGRSGRSRGYRALALARCARRAGVDDRRASAWPAFASSSAAPASASASRSSRVRTRFRARAAHVLDAFAALRSPGRAPRERSCCASAWRSSPASRQRPRSRSPSASSGRSRPACWRSPRSSLPRSCRSSRRRRDGGRRGRLRVRRARRRRRRRGLGRHGVRRPPRRPPQSRSAGSERPRARAARARCGGSLACRSRDRRSWSTGLEARRTAPRRPRRSTR